MKQPTLEQLKAAYDASTQGEWEHGVSSDGEIFCMMGDEAHMVSWDIENSCDECFGNMAFIALAHNTLPVLFDYITALEQRLDSLEAPQATEQPPPVTKFPRISADICRCGENKDNELVCPNCGGFLF